MGFLNFLGKVGSFAGNALRKVGDFGSAVVSKVGSFGVPVYNAANRASGGLIGNFLDNIPVVGPVIKAIGGKLNDPTFMNSAQNVFNRVGAAGGALSKVSEGVGDDD